LGWRPPPAWPMTISGRASSAPRMHGDAWSEVLTRRSSRVQTARSATGERRSRIAGVRTGLRSPPDAVGETDEGCVRAVARLGAPAGARTGPEVAGRRPKGQGVARGSAPRSPGGEGPTATWG